MPLAGCWPWGRARPAQPCALAWIGPTHASQSVGSLRRTLPRSEWQALASARATLPSWMAQAIGREAARG